jgi:hypothetical protein
VKKIQQDAQYETVDWSFVSEMFRQFVWMQASSVMLNVVKATIATRQSAASSFHHAVAAPGNTGRLLAWRCNEFVAGMIL